jgi:hypothetical protein
MTIVEQPTAVAECVLQDDSGQRVYRVVDRGESGEPRWWLTLIAPGAATALAELPLPNARVERSASALAISSASGNGGLAVTIRAAPTAALLDVFVNYELEVNVWRDLSPAVDRMNTNGPRPHAQCRVLSAPEGLP